MQQRSRGPLVASIVGILCLCLFVLLGAHFLKLHSKSDLAGDWQMKLPGGHVFQLVIEPVEDDRWRLNARLFSGLYRMTEDRLEMEEPRDKRLTEFVWKLREDGVLELIEGPPAAKTGSTYVGAEISRLEKTKSQ